MTDSLVTARPLTMQDRLLAAALVQSIANDDPTLRVFADSVRQCVRCCDDFPNCPHVAAEKDRVDREENRV